MAHSAASMVETSNQNCRDIDITIGEFAWFSTKFFKIPPLLSCKPAAYFVGPFPVLYAIGHVSF